MSWIETYPSGAPLQCFVDDPRAWLAVKCEGCGASQPFTFERMIGALKAAGRGDGNTGVRVVAERLRRPCKDCGAVRWRVDVVREHAPGAGTTTQLERPTPEKAARLGDGEGRP